MLQWYNDIVSQAFSNEVISSESGPRCLFSLTIIAIGPICLEIFSPGMQNVGHRDLAYLSSNLIENLCNNTGNSKRYESIYKILLESLI